MYHNRPEMHARSHPVIFMFSAITGTIFFLLSKMINKGINNNNNNTKIGKTRRLGGGGGGDRRRRGEKVGEKSTCSSRALSPTIRRSSVLGSDQRHDHYRSFYGLPHGLVNIFSSSKKKGGRERKKTEGDRKRV